MAIDNEPLALKNFTSYCGQIVSIRLPGAYTDPLEGLSAIFFLRDKRYPCFEVWTGAQLGLKKNLVMFTKKLWEFFCKHNGGNFGKYRPIWFSFLTKKEQGKKRVKMSLTFFCY